MLFRRHGVGIMMSESKDKSKLQIDLFTNGINLVGTTVSPREFWHPGCGFWGLYKTREEFKRICLDLKTFLSE